MQQMETSRMDVFFMGTFLELELFNLGLRGQNTFSSQVIFFSLFHKRNQNWFWYGLEFEFLRNGGLISAF
jgi:hypothetical protein